MKSQDGIRTPNYHCPTLNGRVCCSENSVESAGESVGNYGPSTFICSMF